MTAWHCEIILDAAENFKSQKSQRRPHKKKSAASPITHGVMFDGAGTGAGVGAGVVGSVSPEVDTGGVTA